MKTLDALDRIQPEGDVFQRFVMIVLRQFGDQALAPHPDRKGDGLVSLQIN
jgi:hypothetical protein